MKELAEYLGGRLGEFAPPAELKPDQLVEGEYLQLAYRQIREELKYLQVNEGLVGRDR